jgi:PKD repeat protein
LDNSGAPNGATATAPSQAHVSDAALTGSPSPITAVVGVPFAGPVASFSDPNPFAVAGDFTATITWGDGVTSAGTIEALPSGFLIVGSHTFASAGQLPVGVHVADSQGSTTSVQALAVVSPAPPPPRTTVFLSPASPTGRHGWYRGDVHASLSATTVIGAVVATRCQLDGAAPGSFDSLPARCLFAGGGAQIARDGQHVLYAASINDAGQAERPTATSIAVDATPPTVRCRSSRPVLKTGTVGALVFATVRDVTSGPASQTVAVRAATSSPGTKFARLTGSDNAGNTTTIKCPYQVLGQINPSLVWGFKFQGATTHVESLVAAHVPPRATIRVLCHGAGCRSASRTVRPANKSTCRHKSCRGKRTRNETTVDLTRLVQGWSLHAGTVLEIAISERDTIGRGFVFTMRNGRGPSELAGCLAPRSLVPNHGC